MPAFLFRSHRLAFGLVLTLLALVLAGAPARAELHFEFKQGVVEPIPIAITNFLGQSGADSEAGRNISGVISADLERSGLFKPIDPKAFIQDPVSLQTQPRFEDWKVLKAQALVNGTVQTLSDGRMEAKFQLWDVYAGQRLSGLSYSTTPENWRRVAHIIADTIYKAITGEQGYFDTRIVYIAESGSALHRRKQLAIMDQDGANNKLLTNGDALVLTPRFSPSNQEITYLSYVNNRPKVYLFNIDTGRQELLGEFNGMTFAPRFSPDGNKVIFSQAINGNTDVVVEDLRTRQSQRLTDNPAIDTSPCYSPDGSQVVFESDRGGTQQLYIMNANGSNVHRITFGDGRYAGPVWSPRGDLIAFTRIAGDKFYIGVIRPDGTGERMLTEAFHVEGPTWAPNGRVLMYFKETPTADGKARRTRLYTIDLTGFNEREVITPMDASDPAWSPLNP